MTNERTFSPIPLEDIELVEYVFGINRMTAIKRGVWYLNVARCVNDSRVSTPLAQSVENKATRKYSLYRPKSEMNYICRMVCVHILYRPG